MSDVLFVNVWPPAIGRHWSYITRLYLDVWRPAAVCKRGHKVPHLSSVSPGKLYVTADLKYGNVWPFSTAQFYVTGRQSYPAWLYLDVWQAIYHD